MLLLDIFTHLSIFIDNLNKKGYLFIVSKNQELQNELLFLCVSQWYYLKQNYSCCVGEIKLDPVEAKMLSCTAYRQWEVLLSFTVEW